MQSIKAVDGRLTALMLGCVRLMRKTRASAVSDSEGSSKSIIIHSQCTN